MLEKEKALATALIITIKAESEAYKQLLTPQYLMHKFIKAITKNAILFVGFEIQDLVPTMKLPSNAITDGHE